MKIKLYQVDAFADKVFAGNPAGVCPLEQWLPDDLMQKIAMENNLAETAFYVKNPTGYHIRWFTPAVEVDLCGHATLATAFVLFNFENENSDKIIFDSRSGPLSVIKNDDMLTLDFPTDIISEVPLNKDLLAGFNTNAIRAFRGMTDYMLVFENESQIRNIKVDLRTIAALDGRGVIITAPGERSDFVSRFFAPQSGIDEDPVTGSAHTSLTPYWAKELNKSDLTAIQISPRTGYLQCRYLDDRVEISGKAKLYMSGEIYLEGNRE